MSGYVRIHRTLIGHPAFRNDAEAMAFAWLVAKAAWKPIRVRYKERGIWLGRGQVAISQRDMARALDRDKAWVERLWKRLRSEAMIEVACEAGVAVITICNYAEYQADCANGEAVNEARSKADARQAQGTEQEREKGKKEEKKDSSVETDPPLTESEVVEAWNSRMVPQGFPAVKRLTPERKRKLKARLRENSIDDWQEAMSALERSPFCRGDNNRGWRADFDFLLQPKSFTKLLEGAYEPPR